jgi:hypothetical protein
MHFIIKYIDHILKCYYVGKRSSSLQVLPMSLGKIAKSISHKLTDYFIQEVGNNFLVKKESYCLP